MVFAEVLFFTTNPCGPAAWKARSVVMHEGKSGAPETCPNSGESTFVLLLEPPVLGESILAVSWWSEGLVS